MHDNACEAEALHNEDRRGFILRESEFGGFGNLGTSKIRLLEKGQVEQSNEGQRRTEIRLIKEEQSENLASVTWITRESGIEDEIGRRIIKTVMKRAQHAWHRLTGLVGCCVQQEILAKAYRGIARIRRESKFVSCGSSIVSGLRRVQLREEKILRFWKPWACLLILLRLPCPRLMCVSRVTPMPVCEWSDRMSEILQPGNCSRQKTTSCMK